jgi:hypothetical protein
LQADLKRLVRSVDGSWLTESRHWGQLAVVLRHAIRPGADESEGGEIGR